MQDNVEARPSISDAKLKANRENAQHSTGPRTEAGKKRSSLNAWRVGVTGQLQCLPAEELAVLRKLTDEVIGEYKPVGPTERFLAISCAENMYRISRCRALENGIFANGFMDRIGGIDVGDPEVESSLAAAQTFEAQAHRLALLSTYEGRIRRTLDRDLAALKAAQAERKAAHKKAVEQAAEFVKHARSQGEDYIAGHDFEPADSWGGFVFSEDDIAFHIDREKRRDAAHYYSIMGQDRTLRPKNNPEDQPKAA